MRMLGTADLDLLEAMMEPLRDCPFFVKNAELRYVAANQAAAEVFGTSEPKSLYGRRVADFFPPLMALHYEELDKQVLSSRLPVRDRLELSGRKGDTWLFYSRSPILSKTGEAVGIVATGRAASTSERRSKTYARVSEALRWLHVNFAQPLHIDRLAQQAGVSVSQLERDTARIAGMSLRALQQRLRMSHALVLLEGDGSIAEIAHECGYADQSAFTRRFRSALGVAPSEWRNGAKEKWRAAPAI